MRFTDHILDHLLVRERSSILKSTALLISQVHFFFYLINLIFIHANLELNTATQYLKNACHIVILDPSGILRNLAPFFFVVIVTYIMTISLLFIYAISSFWSKTQSSRSFIHMFQDIGFYHLQIGYLPCLYFITRSLQLHLEEDFNIFDSNWQEIWIVFGLLAGILNFIFGCVFSLFSFEPYLMEGFQARRFSMIDCLILIAKSSLTIGLVFDINNNISREISLILPFLLIIMIGKIILEDSPYYNLRTSSLKFRINSVHLSTSTTALCIVYLKSETQISGMLLWCSLTLLVWFTAIFFEKKKLKILISQIKNSTSETEVFLHLATLRENLTHEINLDGRFTPENIPFLSIIADHHSVCQEKMCFCNYFYQEESEFKIKPQEAVFLKDEFKSKILRNFFEESLKKGKNFAWFDIVYSNIVIMNRLEHYPLALSILHSIKGQNLSLLTKFLIKDSKRKINKYVSNLIYQQDNVVDIKKFMKYKYETKDLKNNLFRVIDLHKKFWEIYQTQNPHMLSLFNLSSKMANLDDKIKHDWISLNEKYSVLILEDMLYYAGYQSIIRNKEYLGQKLIKKHEQQYSRILKFLLKTEEIDDITINQSSNLTIYLSLNKKNIGTVLDCKGKLSMALGWINQDLIGRNINMIIPEYIRSHHDSFLRNHVSSGQTNLLYKNRLIYGQHKNGFILPLKVFVCPSVHLEKEFSYIGIIRPIKTNENTIVINESGLILCCTEEIGRDLGFDPESKIKLNISTFCSSFTALNKIFNTASFVFLNRFSLMDSADQEDLNFLKAKRLLTLYLKQSEGDEKSMLMPANEQEFHDMMDVYKKLKTDGWNQNFNLKERGRAKFLCKISEDQNFTKEKVKFIVVRKMAKIDTHKRTLVKQPQSPLKGTKTTLFTTNPYSTDLYGNIDTTTKFSFVEQKVIEDHGVDDLTADESDEDIPFENMTIEIEKLRSKLEIHREKTIAMEDEVMSSDYSNKNEEARNYNDFGENLHKIINYQQRANFNPESSGSKSSMSNTLGAISEKSLTIKPKATSLKAFILLETFYFTLGMILLIVLNFYVDGKVDAVFVDSSLLQIVTDTEYNILEGQRNLRLYSLIYDGFIPSRPLTDIETNKFEETSFKVMRNLERLTIEKLNKLAEAKGFDDSVLAAPTVIQPMFEGESEITIVFDRGIAEYLYALSVILNKGFERSEEEFIFIEKNSLNSLLLTSENLIVLILENSKNLLEDIESYIQIIISIFSVLCIALLAFGILIEIVQSRKKILFFDGFTKAKLSDQFQYTSKIVLFESLFKNLIAQEDNDQNNGLDLKLKVHVKSKIPNRGRRPNNQGIHRKSILRTIVNFLVLLCLLIGILVLHEVSATQNHELYDFNEALVINKNIMHENLLLFIATYEYISTNKTAKIRNQAVSDQFELELSLSKRDAVYNLAFDHDDVILPEIMPLLQDDLCQSSIIKLDCTNLTSNLLRFGLIGLNSQLTSTLESAKLMFDENNHIALSLENSNLRNIEKIFEKNYYLIYKEIEQAFSNNLEKIYDFYLSNLWIAVISLVLICFFMLVVSYKWIYFYAYEERFMLQRMLETIPLNNIMDSTHLKSFLPITVLEV